MSVKKRRVDDPSDTGKIDVFTDLEERVLADVPPQEPDAQERPGSSVIEAALADRDTVLLRKIASARKGLTDEQRRALLLVADLLDRAEKRDGNAQGIPPPRPLPKR